MVAFVRGNGSADACEDSAHALGMRVRQIPEHERVDDGKDGGICADGKREGEDDGDGEAWIAPQLAQPVACVLPEKLDAGAGAIVAHCLLYLFDAASVCQCAAACLGGRHAGGDFFVGDEIDVRANLVVELAFDLLPAKEITERADDVRPEAHVCRLMLPAMRFSWPGPRVSILLFRLPSGSCPVW